MTTELERLNTKAKTQLRKKLLLMLSVPLLALGGSGIYLYRESQVYTRETIRGSDQELYCKIRKGFTVYVKERGCYDGNE